MNVIAPPHPFPTPRQRLHFHSCSSWHERFLPNPTPPRPHPKWQKRIFYCGFLHAWMILEFDNQMDMTWAYLSTHAVPKDWTACLAQKSFWSLIHIILSHSFLGIFEETSGTQSRKMHKTCLVRSRICLNTSLTRWGQLISFPWCDTDLEAPAVCINQACDH